MDLAFSLYVTDLKISADFYSDILRVEPVQFEPNFIMFFLESGIRMGLLLRDSVKSAEPAQPCGFELDFPVPEKGDVDRIFDNWLQRGLEIIEMPHNLPFEYNFVAFDFEGQRLRVFSRNRQI